jgi:hypothetical protein
MKRRLLREHHGENYEQAILSFPTGDLWPPPPSFFSFQHFLNFPAIAVFLKYPRGKTLELTFNCDSFLPNSSVTIAVMMEEIHWEEKFLYSAWQTDK